MDEMLAAEEIERIGREKSEPLHKAADANTTWSGILVAVLLLVGVVTGGMAAASSVGGQVDSTGPAIFGALVGGFAGFLIGMVIYSQRRLESQIALRQDRYFSSRER